MVVADIDTIESILLKPMGTFDRSSDITSTFGKIIPRALLTLQTNDVYKHHRRVIGTAMTSKYLARATPRAYESARELVELWRVKRDKSEGRAWAVEVDMQGATMVSLKSQDITNCVPFSRWGRGATVLYADGDRAAGCYL